MSANYVVINDALGPMPGRVDRRLLGLAMAFYRRRFPDETGCLVFAQIGNECWNAMWFRGSHHKYRHGSKRRQRRVNAKARVTERRLYADAVRRLSR